MKEYILEMKHITKEFPGVKALNDVNFKVKRGEIHCLVGENGAGKAWRFYSKGNRHEIFRHFFEKISEA